MGQLSVSASAIEDRHYHGIGGHYISYWKLYFTDLELGRMMEALWV
jgi:hypothetical protein